MAWGLDVISYLTKKEEEKGERILDKEVLGTFSEIIDTLHKRVIDEVIICVSIEDFTSAKEVLEICEKEGVQLRINFDFFGSLAKRVSVDYVYDLPIVSFYTTSIDEWVKLELAYIDN